MSSPSIETQDEAPAECLGLSESDGNEEETKKNSHVSREKANTLSPKNSSVTSRYGRAIKPKSPSNMLISSPKNSRMPKTRRYQNSNESSNESVDIKMENNFIEEEVSLNVLGVEVKPLKIEKVSMECHWLLGQLAWARVGNYPFWPCVITLDPVSMIYHKIKSFARSQMLMVHVQYFGDKGRHSWVSSNLMIPFTGLANFQKLADAVTVTVKKKDPKYAAAFVVKLGIRPKWDRAVAEATEVLPMTDDERADIFKPRVKVLNSKSPRALQSTLKEAARKRKLSVDSNEPFPKRTKRDSSDETHSELSEKSKSKKQKRDENGKSSVNLSAETPPTPPSSNKDSSDEAPVSQKPKIKRRKKEMDGDFEIYYERNRDILEDEQPDVSEAEIRKYLKKTWDSMNSTLRSKYQPRIKPKENSSEREDLTLYLDSPSKDNKKSKFKVDKDETVVTEAVKKTRPYNIFKGMKQERVCQICEKTGKLTRCRGPCYSYFHLSCVKPGESSPEHSSDENLTEDETIEDPKEIKENTTEDDENEFTDNKDKSEEQSEEETFKCIDCLSGVAPACFICNEREGDRVRCSVPACGKHYHPVCLKSWPQVHWQGGRLSCPYHICHTCSSDNPQNSHSRAPNEKLARCVRCPSSYHTSTSCLPAGSVILTGSQVLCPKHYKAPHPPLNAAWCFLCTRGGSLICCDTCPTSFHPECLGIDAPDGAFICEDCETGRLPLYGEVVWVKFSNYRWWPSRICYPHEVPQNVAAIPHNSGEFCVMFLGTKNYHWVHRGRAFLYQDGDASTKVTIGKKNVDEAYRRALEEGNEIHQRLKTERAAAKDHEPRGLRPPPYVKLKVNKPVGNVKPMEVDSIVACDCDAEWDNPCAPGTDCLNRILSVECSPDICPAGSKCKNQAFVQRQYPTMEPFHTVGRGWGLKSLEPISYGQFVIEYVGEIIDEAEYKRRLHRKKELKNENFYFLTIDNNRMIDAEPKGNLSRFMNHSCQPNCETQKWTVNGDTRIGLFALRDIDPGEELTFNYNLACDGETRKPCLCGAPNCSGFIGLKVQKQQLSVMQVKKIEKAEKVKRQRRSRQVSVCWTCGDEISNVSDVLKCVQKTCNKRYHKTCVSVHNSDSRFSCPWHHCTECGRRTSSHCLFCSTAFCQVHIDGNLMEYGEKGGFVCKIHENTDMRKSPLEDEKEDSENEIETEKEYSSTDSSSPILTEASLPREPSPRVSIVEVHLSSDEGEESQKEDEDDNADEPNVLMENKCIITSKKKISYRLSYEMQREEERTKILNALTSSQLESIIGGSIVDCESFAN